MAQELLSRPKSYYINSVIAVCIMLFFGFLPPLGSMTEIGMRILGIFLGAIYAWCTVELVWPSFFALICLGFTDYITVPKAFATAASNDTVLTALFFFCIATLVQTSGLGNVIANKILGLKIAKGRPWVLSTILLLAAYIASIMIKQMPAVIICWTFLYNIAEEAKMDKQHKYVELMVVGMVYATIFAQCLLPFFMGVLVNFGMASAAYGAELSVSYIVYMLWAFIFGLVAIAFYVFMCKFILRPDVSGLKNIDYTKFSAESKMNAKQKFIGCYFIALVIALLITSLFPTDWVITKIFSRLGTLGIIMLFVGIALLVPFDGQPLGGKFKNLSALTLAGALVSEGTGIKPLIASIVIPILGDYSPYMFMVVFLLMALILTNLINNVVVSTVLLPIVIPMADTIGFSPLALTALFTVTTTVAILLPSASPSGALMHSNRDHLSAKHALLYAFLANLCYVIALLTVGIPLAMLMM